MNFTPQQEQALEAVRQWLDDPDGQQVFRLFGFAGTGKTTLARHLGADFYAAFTGKAAHVLRQKGCPAQTIHSLIYHPKEKSKERLRILSAQLDTMSPLEHPEEHAKLEREVETEKRNVRQPGFSLNLESEIQHARLVVIDECSMVNEEMGEDLLSFGVRILVLGDPAQLPPVFGGGYFTHMPWYGKEHPDVLLTEIHRQARNNPILDLATAVRLGEEIPEGHPCIHNGKPTEEMVMSADQILVGRNKTRRASNARIREMLGRTDPLPEVGDRVVCLRNNKELGLLNGALYDVTGIEGQTEEFIVLELDGQLTVAAHSCIFFGGEPKLWEDRDAEKFDYGYALTVHKAQGSQWDKVGVINEARAFRQDYRRWLYTAITRAAEELWVA